MRDDVASPNDNGGGVLGGEINRGYIGGMSAGDYQLIKREDFKL